MRMYRVRLTWEGRRSRRRTLAEVYTGSGWAAAGTWPGEYWPRAALSSAVALLLIGTGQAGGPGAELPGSGPAAWADDRTPPPDHVHYVGVRLTAADMAAARARLDALTRPANPLVIGRLPSARRSVALLLVAIGAALLAVPARGWSPASRAGAARARSANTAGRRGSTGTPATARAVRPYLAAPRVDRYPTAPGWPPQPVDTWSGGQGCRGSACEPFEPPPAVLGSEWQRREPVPEVCAYCGQPSLGVCRSCRKKYAGQLSYQPCVYCGKAQPDGAACARCSRAAAGRCY